MGAARVGKMTTAAALAIAGSATANAATVIDLPLSTVLTDGGSTSATFNISSFLSNSDGQFRVTGATLTARAFSNYGTTGYAYAGYYYQYSYTAYAPYTYSYSCGGWLFSRTCYATGYTAYTAYAYAPAYVGVDGVIDTLTVASPGGSATGVTSGYGSPANYYGSLLAELTLSSADLAQINGSGLLQFTASASTNNNVVLNGASLSFNLERAGSAVPEPTTWAMMIAGFGLVGVSMRTRSRRRRTIVA
jgi:hypothetical protein